jgi:hypothetical protein
LFVVATKNISTNEEIIVEHHSFVNRTRDLEAISATDIFLGLDSRMDRAEKLYSDILRTVNDIPVAATKLSLKKATQCLAQLRASPSIQSSPEVAAHFKAVNDTLKEMWEQNKRLDALVSKQHTLYDAFPVTKGRTTSSPVLSLVQGVAPAQNTDVEMSTGAKEPFCISQDVLRPTDSSQAQGAPASKTPKLMSPINTQVTNVQSPNSGLDMSITPSSSPIKLNTPLAPSPNQMLDDPEPLLIKELVEKELMIETLEGQLLKWKMKLEVLPLSATMDFYNTDKYPTIQLPSLNQHSGC